MSQFPHATFIKQHEKLSFVSWTFDGINHSMWFWHMFWWNPQVVTVGARIQLETMCVFKPLISSINNYLKNKFLFVFCCLLEFFMALGKLTDASGREWKVKRNLQLSHFEMFIHCLPLNKSIACENKLIMSIEFTIPSKYRGG